MSTRSGKRIHNSYHENILPLEVEQAVDVERKTRSRRLKENVEELSTSLLKVKKRVNYVSYPSTDDDGTDTVDGLRDEGRSTRFTRKNALMESNLITSSTESAGLPTETKKPIRTTRRTRRYTEDTLEDVHENQNVVEEVKIEETQKLKKGKKKKQVLAVEVVEKETVTKKKPKNKKEKRGRRSSSMIVEDIEPENGKKNSLNKINMSIDSFHSAAGSPQNDLDNDDFEIIKSPPKCLANTIINKGDVDEAKKSIRRQTRSLSRRSNFVMSPNIPDETINESRKRKSSVKDLDISLKEPELDENNAMIKVNKKRKQSIKETISDDVIVEKPFGDNVSAIEISHNIVHKDIKNTTFDLEDNLELRKSINNPTVEINVVDKRKSIKNTTLEKIESSDVVNTTFDKKTSLDNHKSIEDINTTFDVKNASDLLHSESKSQTRQSIANRTFEKAINSSEIDSDVKTVTRKSAVINTTFEKDSEINTNEDNKKRKSKNATFDKDVPSETLSVTLNGNLRKSILSIPTSNQSTELNSTYDKTEKSDATFDKDKILDVTFDKNSKCSLISSDNSNLTLDKSEVSRISITSDDSKEIILNSTPVLIESSLDETQMNTSKHTPKSPVQGSTTPLKREGTFTKDGPEVVSPKLLTPNKRMSLPSPGCTPFHTIKSSSKEKSQLNITRSVEKSRRSSLAEPLPRATMVKFCSPVNNPAVVLQQRRKVIKSNLKGSNKSFVFEETSTEPRAAVRKRSYTQSDADDARVKRKRIADSLLHSVDRLSRPRTTSASGKVPEPGTPSKQPVTPSKKSEAKISRTKLPNFAALHRKQFDRMESLDECQERRARRARQLLTPTGPVTVLDRTSPSETVEPQKSPTTTEPPKKEKATKPKKPETPVKSLPTLKSLNPGYTRFGFKLNLDVNPFSIPSGSDAGSGFGLSGVKSKAKTCLSFSSKKANRDNCKPLKENKGSHAAPSLAGATARRDVARQTVMREKSFTDRRNVHRNENRTVIKGVRTNRRFELQMRMRNID